MSAGIAPGAHVRILTGMAGGRTGIVTSAYQGMSGPVVHVEHERPVLLTRPDGPSELVRLPYAPVELEVLEPEPAPALADDLDEHVPYVVTKPLADPAPRVTLPASTDLPGSGGGGLVGLREVVTNHHRIDTVEPLRDDLDSGPEGVELSAVGEPNELAVVAERLEALLVRLEAALDRGDHGRDRCCVVGHGSPMRGAGCESPSVGAAGSGAVTAAPEPEPWLVAFYEDATTDPRVARMGVEAGYLIARMPRTALEFLAALDAQGSDG
jgi:hypothetical protein